jgi:hypothetical protein
LPIISYNSPNDPLTSFAIAAVVKTKEKKNVPLVDDLYSTIKMEYILYLENELVSEEWI